MNSLVLVVMTLVSVQGHVATAEYNSMAACENARRQIAASTRAGDNLVMVCSKK